MDGGTIFFFVLSIIFLAVIFALNIVNRNIKVVSTNEGFYIDSIPSQIKAVLDPMNAPSVSLCPIYANMRSFMVKNEMASNNISKDEATQRVEKTLSIKIPGGALQCPFLTYPADSSSDDDWIEFLTRVPSDFGARVIFMAMYARKELKRRAANIKAGLSGGKVTSEEEFDKLDKDSGNSLYEDFTLFTPTLRPVENWADADEENDSDTDEEKLKKKRQKKVTSLLKNLVTTRDKTLQGKGVSTTIDIGPIIAEAQESNNYIATIKAKTEDGTIVNDINLPA
jgi:hypothetical protein